MLRSGLFSIFLILFSFSGTGQTTYQVVTILGTIVNKTEKDTLKEDSKYLSTDEIVFADKANFMGVIDENENTFMVMLHPEEDTIQYESIPLARGGRPGKITNSIGLVLHFAENTQYLIVGDQMQIELSPLSFPMNADTFFYVRYQYQGGETINKRLPFNEEYAIIAKDELFEATYQKSEILGPDAVGDTVLTLDPRLATQFEFRYYTTSNNGSHLTFFDPQQPNDQQNRMFIPFKPVFLDHPSLVNEITTLYQSLQRTRADQEQKSHLQAIKEYLENKYQGQVYLDNLERWMRKRAILE